MTAMHRNKQQAVKDEAPCHQGTDVWNAQCTC